ncbi:hypothetical protein NliqN6_6148 [Naganishia liquefaciens]|uniref:Xylanolytic transcriptional activator regulatory domain-containing protein n=1 Tax=Naganishia liquefaciens TaxID=104408 RepID=A0A8H3TY48_9TREE|nr:hypothetical protein NliqN6_6148 [Naganishia liquefaciens]
MPQADNGDPERIDLATIVESRSMPVSSQSKGRRAEPASKGNNPAPLIFRQQRGPVASMSHGYSSRDGSLVNGDSPVEQIKTLVEPPMMEVPPVHQPFNVSANMGIHQNVPIPPPSFIPNADSQSTQRFARRSSNLNTVATKGIFESLRQIRRSLPSRERPTSPVDRFRQPQGGYVPTLEYESLNSAMEQEENHYINPQAFTESTLEDVKERGRFDLEAPYRQLSSDSKNPAFFTKNPSLIYGLSQAGGAGFFQKACETIGYEWPPRLLPLFLQKTVAAFPIVDSRRLQAYLTDHNQTPFAPYALFAAILAHMTTYISEIRAHHKQLWVQVLLAMEDEFRLPRLQTVQLALVILTSRPAINSGQNTILTARAIGAAQLIGLHVDPTNWKLPRWERNLRKRVMWGLIIHDKWRALIFGRPSNLHSSSFSVSLPTLDDMDPDTDPSPEVQDSMRAFCGLCRLTLILDDLLVEFHSVKAITNPHRNQTRLRLLEGIGEDLGLFSRSLPESFRIDRSKPTPASGVRSLQLSQLGLGQSVVRLMLTTIQDMPSASIVLMLQTAFESCVPLVEFLEMISDADAGMFWVPYAPYHIINCASLILRIMILAKRQESPLRVDCGNLLARMISTLSAAHHGYSWDVASLALDRIAILIASVEMELPEVTPLRTTFSQHHPPSAPLRTQPTHHAQAAHTSHPPPRDAPRHGLSSDNNMPIMGDSLWWMHNDITNFPENFDWTLDGFAQFAANDAANGPSIF